MKEARAHGAPAKQGARRVPGKPGEALAARAAVPGTATPGGTAVKEMLRALSIAEKNHQLYPTHGRVVQQSIAAFEESVKAAVVAAGSPIELQVTPQELIFGAEVVYHEEARARSIAGRLHADSVRKLILQEGLGQDEIVQLLDCFRQARQATEDGDDFSTIFWGKDLSHVAIETAEDFTAEDAMAVVPVSLDVKIDVDPKRFRMSDAEERALREALARKGARREDQGDSRFELTPDEAAQVRKFVDAEEHYFPLYDFLDLLFEHTARRRDHRAFTAALKTAASVLEKLIASFDFEHALGLMERLAQGKDSALNDQQRSAIRQLSSSLSSPKTLSAIGTFLKETSQLPRQHPVFRFMRSLGHGAVTHLCPFLVHAQHAPAVSDVLIELAAGHPELIAPYLLHEDVQIARASVPVVLATDTSQSLEWISPAFRHPDEGVRLHVARILLESGNAKATPHFVGLLRSESKHLTPVAIQYFTRVRCPQAFDDLLRFSESRRFFDLDSQKQDQCFRALVLADQDRAFRHLAGELLYWRWTWGKTSTRKKAAALRALALVPHAAAREVLDRFARLRSSSLGAVARRVLDVLKNQRASGSKPELAPEEEMIHG